MSKVSLLKNTIGLYAFILIVWGFYRFLFRLPETIEELILKPLIWLGPLLWVLLKEKGGLPRLAVFGEAGWTTKNLFKSIYLAIALGVFFAIEGAFVNSIKYGGSFNFIKLPLGPAALTGALGISLVTALSEETVFRGFIFTRLWRILGKEWSANIATSVAWSIVHLPITLFVFNYTLVQILTFLLLTLIFGITSSFIFARTRNIASSVLLHIFWEWPIILFR